jgi:hypothetical protein
MEMEHGPTPRPWQRDSHNTSLLSGVDAVRSVALPHTNEKKKKRQIFGAELIILLLLLYGPSFTRPVLVGGIQKIR